MVEYKIPIPDEPVECPVIFCKSSDLPKSSVIVRNSIMVLQNYLSGYVLLKKFDKLF